MFRGRLQMCRRLGGLIALAVGLFASAATPALAQPGSHYFSVEVDATCDCLYEFAAWGWTDANTSVTVNYSFTVTAGGVKYPVNASVTGTADSSGAFLIDVKGLSLPGGCGSDVTISPGVATLTDSTGLVIGSFQNLPASLVCGLTPPPPGKALSIGPSSMEGNLNIRPGDWVSGGYSFVFVDGSHAATTVNVTSTLTMPYVCSNGTSGQFIINLGSHSYNVPAGDKNWQPTGDANNILSWAGSGQAPEGCGPGNVMNNSRGGIFSATITQVPDTGSLINWRFKYRDPNAKGKGNVNCLDATDPRRAKADVCGASWSQTVKDP